MSAPTTPATPVTPTTPPAPPGVTDETLPGQILPVAGRATLRAYLATLARRHRRLLVTMLGLHAAAALAGLVAPRLLGAIVEEVQSGGGVGTVDRLTLVIAVALVAQTVLTRAARYRSFVFGEEVLAELREDFVRDTLALPIGTVESAGSRRPADPDLPRRRAARVVRPLGTARVADRAHHRGPHRRRGPVRGCVGGGCRC